jgi:hypothetical protein
MEGHSRTDMSFGFNMKSKVHCREFYQSDETILQRHRNNLPSIFSLQFPFSAVKHGVSKGSMLVAGENCLNDLESIFSSSDGVSDIDDIEDCRQFLLRNRWVEEYKQIVRDPVTRCEDMSFDEINSVFRHFHALRPIVVDSEDKLAVDSVTQLHRMLESSGVGVMPIDELLELPPGKRLVTCDCKSYLHYCWCKHSCACAFDQKIVTLYPPTLNPKQISRQAAVAGRLKHARPRDVFNKNG